MKFIVTGVGPGDPDLMTLRALKIISGADLVLAPHSKSEVASVAEGIVRANLKDIKTTPITLPMTNDGETRDSYILAQLEALRPEWENAKTIALPVIGDAAIYATGSYLYDVWKKLAPNLELELVPGISAHSLATSRSGGFLAMGEEILTLIPGTNSPEDVQRALSTCDSAAIYKPSALKENIVFVVTNAGPWRKIMRVDRAGLEDEKIYEGSDALKPTGEYLSILLLWR